MAETTTRQPNVVQEAVLQEIRLHRDKCDAKWGGGSMRYVGIPNEYKLAILAEEFGEVARAVLEKDTQNLYEELLDVAQVAVAWLEAMPL